MIKEQLLFRDQGRTVVGRVVVNGVQMSVERRNPIDSSFKCIGYYEDLIQPSFFNRKLSEIDSAFSDWATQAEYFDDPACIKASWTPNEPTPKEFLRDDSDRSGIVIVSYQRREIARLYKYKKTNKAIWIASTTR